VVQEWARDLGQEVFTGSSGRVFPVRMKASPLLRAWLVRLAGAGVGFRTRWRWTGWKDGAFVFDTPDGVQEMRPAVTVLALGGASWSRLGSDGAWSGLLNGGWVALSPFKPANTGFSVNWSPYMERHFGTPVKGVELTAGAMVTRGEFVVSHRGIEGGGIYAVSKEMREGAALYVDLLPDLEVAQVAGRLERTRGKATLTTHLRKTLRLNPVKLALLQEFARPLPRSATALAQRLKRLEISHAGPRPLDEAISTAGGVRFDAMTPGLELKAVPGVFCAGEMLDWEAPTGGYLVTACMATGRWAGRAAANSGG
jgi:uncharacterized flavoprotein (TIGR03862 family)